MFAHGPNFMVSPITPKGRMIVHRARINGTAWDAIRLYIQLPNKQYRYLTWWAPPSERQLSHRHLILVSACNSILRKLEARKIKPALYRLGRPPQSFRR